MREISERAFEAYGEPIQNFSSFRYLGRVLTAGDDNWRAVVGNLGKARKSWGRLSQILILEGEDPKVSGNFYKAMAQAVFMFGRRRRSSPRGWSGPWAVFNTGLQGGSPGAATATDRRDLGITVSGGGTGGSGV